MLVNGNDSDNIIRKLLVDSGGRPYVLLSDGTNTASFDNVDASFVTIDLPHHKIHDGRFFTACRLFENVADAGTAEILLVTGSTREIHLSLTTRVDGQSLLALFEDTTVSDNGTQITEQNNNRNSSNTADMDVYYTPTITGDGTQICGAYIPAGERKSFLGGEHSSRIEWILDGGSNYLIRVTNNTGDVENIGIKVEWYED